MSLRGTLGSNGVLCEAPRNVDAFDVKPAEGSTPKGDKALKQTNKKLWQRRIKPQTMHF